ncbi:hypothetical protein CCP3SC1AL1_10039 [Gammaproteobacteria bacterium]
MKEILERAQAAEAKWRQLFERTLQQDFNSVLSSRSDRINAEQALHDVCTELGAALLEKLRHAKEQARTHLLEVLEGTFVVPVGEPPVREIVQTELFEEKIEVLPTILSTQEAESRTITVEVPEAPKTPASEEKLLQFRKQGIGYTDKNESSYEFEYSVTPDILEEIIEKFDVPSNIFSKESFSKEIQSLKEVTEKLSEGKKWVDKKVSRLICHYLVARQRNAQEINIGDSSEIGIKNARDLRNIHEQIKEVVKFFSSYTTFYVHGLSLSHLPTTGTWPEDAKKHLQGLKDSEYYKKRSTPQEQVFSAPELTLDTQSKVQKNRVQSIRKKSSNLKEFTDEILQIIEDGLTESEEKQIIDSIKGYLGKAQYLEDQIQHLKLARFFELAQEELESEANNEDSQKVSLPKELLEKTRDKHVIIAGQSERKDDRRIRQIRERFEFEEVEWIELKTPGVEGLSERVKNGTVDLVILLYSIQHRDSLPIIAAESNRCKVVRSGSGIEQMRNSIEEAFSRG